MRSGLVLVSAALVGTIGFPALAAGERDKDAPKAEAEKRVDDRRCKADDKKNTDKCRIVLPPREEGPSSGPIDRAYHAPFF